MILDENKNYLTGLVLKDVIRNSGPFWEEVYQEIFEKESTIYYIDESSVKYTDEQKNRVFF